jgi:Transposase DDE domain
MRTANLSQIGNQLLKFFSKTVDKIDKEAKFVKRQSKLNARRFVESLLINCLSDSHVSLSGICALLKRRGISITQQGLHQRFNAEATQLMEGVFKQALEMFKTERFDFITLLKPFSTVQMIDSSGISLPSELKGIYKGLGGLASEAGMKLQVLFDYLKGEVNDITITPASQNDQGFEKHLEKIQEGALFLQDLGYFKLQSFKRIAEKNAYFVSRHFYTTNIYDDEGNKLDLLNELRTIPTCYTKTVYLGSKEKIKVRLIATRLSEAKAQERIKKIRRSQQKKGKAPTKATLEYAKWSIYLTNISEDVMSNEQIHLLYSLRWQIELFFKLCKGEAGVDVINGKKVNRVLCEIYAKLICVLQLLYICFPIRWGKTHEISFHKAFKQFRAYALDFFKAIKTDYLMAKFIRNFISDLQDFAFKDRHRKNRRLTIQLLMDAKNQDFLL